MNIRQLFGEIDSKDIIDVGDLVNVKFNEISGQKEINGRLIEATEKTIKINDTTPPTAISIESILNIAKISGATLINPNK